MSKRVIDGRKFEKMDAEGQAAVWPEQEGCYQPDEKGWYQEPERAEMINRGMKRHAERRPAPSGGG